MTTADLADIAVRIAAGAPGDQAVEALVRLIRAGRPGPLLRAQASTTVRDAPPLVALVGDLVDAWTASPTVSPQLVAAQIDAAYRATVMVRATQRVEAVVTGPQTSHVALRLTRQVFESVAGDALRDLLVLTYAAFDDQRIRAALTAAAARGVDVRVVVETDRSAGGTLSHSAVAHLASLHPAVSLWTWHNRPILPAGSTAAMHAKGVVADRRIAFLTSANLTGRAFDDNIEVGLRVVGGDAPRQLHDHFLALMSQGVLTPTPVG